MPKIVMCTISSYIQVHLYLTMNNNTDVTRERKRCSVKKGIAHCVVMELVSPLSNIGYIVYIDNYYSSPTPFLDLKQKEFEDCRRVRG